MEKRISAYMWNLYEVFKGPMDGPGTRVPTDDEIKEYFKTAGYPYSKGTHWCGVFQTHCLVKAGVACHWKYQIVDDSGGQDLEITYEKAAQRGLQWGDIVRTRDSSQHHFMIVEPAASGWLPSFEGNAGGPKRPKFAYRWAASMDRLQVSNIQIRYRVLR